MLDCGHEQQTIEGVPLPCADWRCKGSPGGEAYVVRTREHYDRGRRLLFTRAPAGSGIAWRLDSQQPIDYAALEAENSARMMRDIHDGFNALDDMAIAREALEWIAGVDGSTGQGKIRERARAALAKMRGKRP